MLRVSPGLSRKYANTSLTPGTGDSDDANYYGRVVDVILDVSHPKIKSLGGTQALYGVFFQKLFTQDVDEERDEFEDYNTRFAYCGLTTCKQIPVKGEIVRLETKLATSNVEDDYNQDTLVPKLYWVEIVPLWNNPHLNLYPDTKALEGLADLGPDFKENADIKPLQLCTGDTALEGRYGQSLRFGGTRSKLSPIATEGTNKFPYTILRNGQAEASGDTSFEDINRDDSSIYLTSNHKVPLTEANRTFKGAKKVPELAGKYQGKQIVANSDRVVLNAREDNLTLAAKKHASINAASTSIDGEEYVGVDGKKIYLGSFAQEESEPVLKGQVSVDFLKELYQILYTFFNTQGTSLASAGSTAWEKAASVPFTMAGTQLQTLFTRVDSLKSKKVYTE